MRILLLTDSCTPDAACDSRQLSNLGEEFARRGHAVTILIPCVTISERLQVDLEAGVRVARVNFQRISASKIWLGDMVEPRLSRLFWRGAKGFLLDNPLDLIIVQASTVFLGALVRRLKAVWQCPVYLIRRGISREWTESAGITGHGLAGHVFRRMETAQYDLADVIAVQSTADLGYFARRFPAKAYRLEMLHNWGRRPESAAQQIMSHLQMATRMPGDAVVMAAGSQFAFRG